MGEYGIAQTKHKDHNITLRTPISDASILCPTVVQASLPFECTLEAKQGSSMSFNMVLPSGPKSGYIQGQYCKGKGFWAFSWVA